MSNKWGWGAVLAFAGLLVITDAAMAQGQGRGGFGGRGRGGIVALVANEAVQKELGLDDAAKEKLASIARSYGEEAQELFQGLGNLRDASAQERQEALAKMAEGGQKLQEKYTPQLKEALSADQFKRLQQISWQAAGAAALTEADVVKALDISKEQSEKIAGVIQDYGQKSRGLFGGGAGGDFQAIAAKMRELNQERDAKAIEILSKEQQDKFSELKGKEFDLAQLMQGRRRGGTDN